jgi:hypothetical protein
MTYKKFDQKLFNKNDVPAREAAKKFWESRGVHARDNPDVYGPDLILDIDNLLEVEIKHTWRDKFPFDTLQLPARKEKFAKIGCMFMVFNSALTQAFLFDGDTVLDSPKKEVYNKYVSKGELFFQIPINKVRLCEL